MEYTISYGQYSADEHQIKVVCSGKDIETVAMAIYRGEGYDKGVLVVSGDNTERILLDRM